MINLENVSILGYNRSNSYLGESFRYASKDSLKIQTSLYDLTNTSGVSGILTQLSGMSVGSTDWQPITLRGNYLGLAQINNVSYVEGIDVRLKDVVIDLTIYNSGNLFNLTNPSNSLYSGINFSNINYPAHLIESLNEDFTCEVAENGNYIQSQTIQIKMLSGGAIGTTQNPLVMAKQLSANLITSNPNIGFINSNYSGYKQKPGKRTYTETQNLITNEYSITETFKLINGFSGTYSVNYKSSLDTDPEGITTVKEQGRVQGLVPDAYGNYFAAAKLGGQYEVNNFSYPRCSGLFSAYKSPTNNYPLNTRRLSYGQLINKYSDIYEYEAVYSNDPKINDSYSSEYTLKIEKETNSCNYFISEEGIILGYSTECNPVDKYSNALAGYAIVNAAISGRLYDFYTSISTFANAIKLINRSETKSKILGRISYERTYTDNLVYSYDDVRKMEIEVTDDYAVPLKNNFNIPNHKEIVQLVGITTLANRSVSINMLGNRGTTLQQYKNLAKNQLNTYIPGGTDPYISDINYSFTPLENNFSCDCKWVFY